MDQAITLHARPTDVKDGDTRRMWRCSGYLDKLYPGKGPGTMKINLMGNEISWDELFAKIDKIQREEYNLKKWSKIFRKMP